MIRTVIETPDKKILLMKRNDKRKYNPTLWEIPGGKLLENETIENALERLVVRETGLIVKKTSDKHYIHSRVVTEKGKYHGYSYIEAAVPSVYLAGSVKISHGDHSRFAWVSLDKALDNKLSIESRKFISQYISDRIDSKDDEEGQTMVRIVSRALVRNNHGKYLLLKRSTKVSYPEMWELPGGKLLSFESLEEHLLREVLSETGLIVRVTKPNIYIHTFVPKVGRYKGVTFLNIINLATVKSGRIRLSDEHSDSKWVTAEEIFDYDLTDYSKLPLTEILEKIVSQKQS
ncbi:MAG: NUDIX domain-containing protein [Patescibacteria group bacterium]|nr:NUDIX domain-containing protein [Patescibacteria group bacterium]